MKKLSFFAVVLAAVAFVACKGTQNNNNQDGTDSVKSFEQEQIEQNIKVQIDSLASDFGKLKPLPMFKKEGDGKYVLTDEEKQVKPDYLFAPSVAESAITLAEKYRAISALSVDKEVAKLYDMPTDEYEEAITKLASDINDPSFKVLDGVSNVFAASGDLYNAMNENGRINYFWQLAASSIVEQLYVASQNSEKFIGAFDDESVADITLRVALLQDAIERLSAYDPELVPVTEAIKPLAVFNAITVDEFKTQLEQAKEDIAASHKSLIK
ncbi:MAG: hypothetical protein J5616_02205 [Bacteroidaceae bacterium]|nr:hypothetical protein [Bacteroidaceae bacterium]